MVILNQTFAPDGAIKPGHVAEWIKETDLIWLIIKMYQPAATKLKLRFVGQAFFWAQFVVWVKQGFASESWPFFFFLNIKFKYFEIAYYIDYRKTLFKSKLYLWTEKDFKNKNNFQHYFCDYKQW